ncbi:hypothetical protein J2X36_002147 [Methylobacterium sp. BE186]|nr:hypothetical protein [Methylobacterium sp. BE186]
MAFIDHVNGDKADNAIANLREATNSQNQANRRRPTRNTSGLKGVCRSPTKDKWVAYINVKGRRRNLGTYEWHWQAKEAYVAAHLEAFGAHSSPYYDGEPRLG